MVTKERNVIFPLGVPKVRWLRTIFEVLTSETGGTNLEDVHIFLPLVDVFCIS